MALRALAAGGPQAVRVEKETTDDRKRILRAGALTFSADLLPVDLAIREWARHSPPVADRLARVDRARMAGLRSWFAGFVDDPEEIEARCILAFTLAIGRHFIEVGRTGVSSAVAIERAARLLIEL